MVGDVILEILGCLVPIVVVFGLKGLFFLPSYLKTVRRERLLKSAMKHLGIEMKRSISGGWNMYLIGDKRRILLLENFYQLRHELFEKSTFMFMFFDIEDSVAGPKVIAINNVFKGMTDEEILMHLDLNVGIDPTPAQVIF